MQDGVDAGEIVVHSGAVDTDQSTEVVLHRVKPPRREAEGPTEAPEIVVVARRGDGVAGESKVRHFAWHGRVLYVDEVQLVGALGDELAHSRGDGLVRVIREPLPADIDRRDDHHGRRLASAEERG